MPKAKWARVTWERVSESMEDMSRPRGDLIREHALSFAVYRAKVPGGWLVTLSVHNRGPAIGKVEGITFVPDPEYQWYEEAEAPD